jgi:hypothetical protein
MLLAAEPFRIFAYVRHFNCWQLGGGNPERNRSQEVNCAAAAVTEAEDEIKDGRPKVHFLRASCSNLHHHEDYNLP